MASETLAKLVVKMEADSARLQRDLDKANNHITRFERSSKNSFDSIGNSIKGFVGGLVAISSVRAFGQLISDTASAGAEVDKLSKRLGVSTEFLSRMTYGAETTGATFDDLRSGLEKLERSTAKGEDGLAKTVDAFKALGINVEEFTKLNAEQRFVAVADAIKRTGASAEASNASFLLLGNAAGRLDELMRGGADGIRQVSAAADKAGVTLDKNLVSKLKEADDALDEFSQSWKGLKIILVETIGLPVVQWINDVVAAWKRLGQLGVGDFKEVFTSTTEELAGAFRASQDKAKPISSFLFSDVGKNSDAAKADIISAAQRDAETYIDAFLKNSKGASNSLVAQKIDRSSNAIFTPVEIGPPEDLLAKSTAIYQEAQNERLSIQREALDAEFAAAIEQEEKLNDLWERTSQERRASILSSTSSTLGSLAILADGHNKKAFKMSQRLARAQATVDAIAAATAAAKSAASLGPYAAFAAYASVAIGLAARIKQINSMSYESGGGSISSGGGGGATATTPNSTPSGIPISNQQNQTPIVVQITVNGSVYPADLNALVVGEVQRFVNNDGVLIQSNTASAREIMRA